MLKSVSAFLCILCLLLAFATVFIFIKRKDYEFKKQSTYDELYQPFEAKGIQKLDINKNNALLHLTGYPANWVWKLKIDTAVITSFQSPFQFQLKENIHHYYFIAPDSSANAIELIIDYASKEQYAITKNSTEENTEIRYASVPFIIPQNSKWEYDYNYISEEEKTKSKALLQTTIGITVSDTDTVKFKKIAAYIYKILSPKMGAPPDSLFTLTPYEQLQCILTTNVEVWCGNFSELLNYFCTLANLKIRKVGFIGSIDGVSVGVHAANEIYLPGLGGWVYTDLTQNLLFVTDEKGRYLNAADLITYKTLQQNPLLNAMQFINDTVQYLPITAPEKLYGWKYSELIYPYPHNPKTLYSFTNKWKRYFTETVWFELYNPTKIYNNRNFYLKQYLFVSLLVLCVLFLLSLFIKKKKKHD